jgi:hypothetical protein
MLDGLSPTEIGGAPSRLSSAWFACASSISTTSRLVEPHLVSEGRAGLDVVMVYTLPRNGKAGLQAHARKYSLARIVTRAMELAFSDSTRRLGKVRYGGQHGGFVSVVASISESVSGCLCPFVIAHSVP